MDLISVIIPVWKKSYLTKCIESIVCQSYTHLEIILINDGSYNGASEICDDYLLDIRIMVEYVVQEMGD